MKNFNVTQETQNIINWIREYFNKQPNAKGAVLGISGGKDSTVVAKLLVEALGKDKVYGVLMPNGFQSDLEDSYRVVDLLGIRSTVINIKYLYNEFFRTLISEEISKQAKINVSPRLRMTVLYAIAGSKHYRVCGTSNLSESYIGYCTKHGDIGVDFNPIGNLTTSEVIAMGDYLGLPYDLVHKTPSDGLCGKSDEDNLGFSYDQVNKVIKNGACGNKEIDIKIKKLHEYNEHKRNMPVKYIMS